MRLLIITAALAIATAAHAGDAPPKPVEHVVKLTSVDLDLIHFLASRTGERCAQDEQFCQAQILLNDLGRRIIASIAAEPKPKDQK